MKVTTRSIARAGIIAALYAAITLILAPISYGPIQVRIAESLTVLPFLFPSAIAGLYFGCMAANIYGGYGLIDIFGGSAITLFAALLTFMLRSTRKPWLAPLPAIIFNAFGVSLYVHQLANIPYWLTVGQIAIGQTIACFFLGYPLLLVLIKKYNRLS